jgi:general secretion pathway protein I
MSAVPRPAASGFSLLELLVALSIMSMALGLLYQASTGALRGVGDLAAEQRANVLAQSILDTRDAVPAAGWNETGRAADMSWQVSSTPYQTAVARQAPAVPPLHEVRVLVQWDGRRGARQLELHTLLPQQRVQAGESR